jgi:hypothetical protein
MYDVDILETLQQAVIVAVTQSQSPTLPVKYVGRDFDIPDDQKWLELVFIPSNRKNDFWGSEKNYMGLMRLILHWPNDGAGVYAPMRMLASIALYFTKERHLQNVKICETPDLTSGPLEQGKELLFPASMRYQSFRQ